MGTLHAAPACDPAGRIGRLLDLVMAALRAPSR
jgi:hypothetical protein